MAIGNLSFCLISARVRCSFLNNASPSGKVVSNWLPFVKLPIPTPITMTEELVKLAGLIYWPTPVVWELRPGNEQLYLAKER